MRVGVHEARQHAVLAAVDHVLELLVVVLELGAGLDGDYEALVGDCDRVVVPEADVGAVLHALEGLLRV